MRTLGQSLQLPVEGHSLVRRPSREWAWRRNASILLSAPPSFPAHDPHWPSRAGSHQEKDAAGVPVLVVRTLGWRGAGEGEYKERWRVDLSGPIKIYPPQSSIWLWFPLLGRILVASTVIYFPGKMAFTCPLLESHHHLLVELKIESRTLSPHSNDLLPNSWLRWSLSL